jgi:hypothetical protein
MSKTSDRYVKVVAGAKDHLHRRCPGLMLGGVHGGDERAVYTELCEAVDGGSALNRKADHYQRRHLFAKSKRSSNVGTGSNSKWTCLY